MKSKNHLQFLGSGGSMGIPVIGCECPVCRSGTPENMRLRPSVLVTMGSRRFLVDAGPDLRNQALRYRFSTVDGVILTHAHNDHVAGIDELRLFCLYRKAPLPLLLSSDTYRDVAQRFPYIFGGDKRVVGLVATFDVHLLEAQRGKVDFEGIPISYVTYEQAGMAVNGFRIGDMAYISDIRTYPETIFEDLAGVKVLVVTALRFTQSHLHFTVDEAIDFAEKIGAEQTWLTHISHDLDHEKTNAYLPPHVRMAYDGLEIPFHLA